MQFIKSILLALVLLGASAVNAHAQVEEGDDTYYQEPPAKVQKSNTSLAVAGYHLSKFSEQYYIGLGLMGGGVMLSISSANSNSPGLAIVGSLAFLSGVVLQVVSHRHIGKAGKALQQGAFSQRLKIEGSSSGLGLGLVYKL